MSNDTTLNINQMLDAFKIEFLQQQLLHNQIQQKMFSILEGNNNFKFLKYF